MTTINCSSNCKHQHDGKCTLDSIATNPLSSESDCIFFVEIPEKPSKTVKISE